MDWFHMTPHIGILQREETTSPGLPLATHVNPAKVKNKIPYEEEVEAEVRQLHPYRAGGHIHLRAEHFKQRRWKAYPGKQSKTPPAEVSLDVPGRYSTSHVEHGGYPTGSGMDSPDTNPKGDHRHMRHRPVKDPAEGGGGAD